MPALNRRGVLLSVGLGLLLLAASADAERPWRLPKPVPAYSAAVECAEGRSLPTFRHEGRTFVLGEHGERYTIRIENPTNERVEAVVSVDGRDAISGSPGDYRSQRGYIVPAFGSVRIEGFRRSLHEVASFRFSTPEGSYAARRGTPENVGVIGVAFFRERTPVAHREPRPFPRRATPEEERRDSRARGDAPSATERGGSQGRRRADIYREEAGNLGTEYGEYRESSVFEVAFERRAHEPDRLTTLRYDDARGLERRGIDVRPWISRGRRVADPEPFPQSRFAEPPENEWAR